LSRRQRILFIAVAAAVALTRLAALSRTLWDWDEVLFSTALHHFDVAAHHPHPPGFPLYVALGRVVRFFLHDDFRALQAINLVAAMLLFPAVFLLARAFRFDFATSMSGALLFAFLPNVVFFGGTAFSDVPSLAALVFALAMLLRGRESRRDFFLGCLLLGVALAFRPQNLLVAAYPLLAASWARFRARWVDVIAGAAIVTAIIVLSYGTAAYVTGFDAYRVAIRKHSDYLMVIDSYRNPDRLPIRTIFPKFLLHPFGGSRVVIGLCVAAAVAIAAACPRLRTLEVLITFAPFFLTGVLLLNVESSSRYSITWLVGICLLAAEGFRVVSQGGDFVAALRRPLMVILTLAFVAKEAQFANRALAEPRSTVSPTIAAVRWIRAHVPLSSTLYVARDMQAFADAYLGDYTQAPVRPDGSFDVRDARGAWLVREWASPSPDAINFTRARHELFDLVRERYFEVSVQPLSDQARYVEGWYDAESSGPSVWRWMAQRSVTELPPISGRGELWMRIFLPLDAARHPTVTVTFNGATIDRFVCTTAVVERTYHLDSRLGTPNELRLDVDQIVNPAREHLIDDGRDLGLQLRGIAWRSR
jgi:hypothetical protein